MVKLPSFKSQKEAFLFYLHRMDIDMIDLILDDSYSYFDVPKDIFVNKLKYFKSELEVNLKIYSNQITIYQKDQTSNTYFLSIDIYDFEQEITFNEVDNKIVDINSEFNSKLKKWSPLDWHFGLDERVNFHPSVEYLLQLNYCTNAVEEIANQQVKIIDYDTIEYWLNKHQLLYSQVKDEIFMFKLNNFRKLYELLTDLKGLMECSFPAKLALDNFYATNEDAIQKWKNDYLTLFVGFVEIFEGFFTEYDKLTYIGKNDVVQLAFFSNVYLLRDDFLDIKKFRDLYFTLSNFSSLELDTDDFPF